MCGEREQFNSHCLSVLSLDKLRSFNAVHAGHERHIGKSLDRSTVSLTVSAIDPCILLVAIQMTYLLCGRFLDGLVHRGQFVLGFGWAYTQRTICIRFWVGLYTEDNLY